MKEEKEKTKMKNKNEKNMKEKNIKKKIRLLGLMAVLALSLSCAESNADNTPGPPSDIGIVMYVLGADKTKGPQLIQNLDRVVQAEEGRELIFLVTTNLDKDIMVTYEFMEASAGAPPASGDRVCEPGLDYEIVPNGVNTAKEDAFFPIQSYICPDDMAELDEEFRVRISSTDSGVGNSPYEIKVVIPNYDKALVSVENIRQAQTAGTANIEITLSNVDMPISEGLIINYEVRGVEGANSVEAADFIVNPPPSPDDPPSFPSGSVEFDAVNAGDTPKKSAPIQFAQDSDSADEEFEIFISLGSLENEEHKDIAALANDRARGYILTEVVDPNAPPPPVGCERSSTTRHPDAIEISTIEELQEINTNDFTRSRHYILTQNIDANVTETWNGGLGFQPIGRYISRCRANGSDQNYRAQIPFTGSFDGNGHTISNLYINRPRHDYVGLFGAAENAQICRLGLVNANITGWGYVGGIAGFATLPTWRQYEDLIKDTFVTGSVAAGHGIVGGLVGVQVRGSIIKTYSTATVSGPVKMAGGLIARSRNSVSVVANSYATGDVSGGSFVGGLVADACSNISNSYSTGIVDGGEWTGGLIGRNYHNISNSYSASLLTLKPGRKGGLIGWNGGETSQTMHGGLKINGKNYFLSDMGGDDGVNSYGFDQQFQYNLTGCPADRCIIATGNTDEERRDFLLKSLDETAMGWDANVWGRLNSSTHFPCIKGLPIYDNNGMLGDKDACQ